MNGYIQSIDSLLGFYFATFGCSNLGHWVICILAIGAAAFLAFVFIASGDVRNARSDLVRRLISINHILCCFPFCLYSTGTC